jgi:hypothetical protein
MFYLAQQSKSDLGRLIFEVTRSHTLRHTTNTIDDRPCLGAGFIPVIRAIKRLQTYAVIHTATESALLYLLTL